MDIQQIKSELKERVAKGLNFGIEAVEDVINPESNEYNDFILLKSKYNDLMYMSSLNTLVYEQIELGLDRLRNALIQLIHQLDDSGLKNWQVNADLKIQALPARRANFFKLLDIYFINLDGIRFIDVSGNEEVIKTGREAIYELYRMNRFKFRNSTDLQTPEGIKKVKESFAEYFGNESGVLEVYFKNIKHLIAYTLESEIERQFFLNTLKSLFSRYEMGMIFYYAISGIDPEFEALIRKSNMIDAPAANILIHADHLNLLT